MKKESILMILKNSESFMELEENIFDFVCEETLNLVKEIQEEIDEQIMKNKDKKRFKNYI
ncbi:MAG: hypothetical protein ACOC4G_14280 [Bacillota bacterium]